MEGEIQHRAVRANGIDVHVAEKGSGPAVLLLHGFPELWYSWRHQISYLAARGFRAIAPDLRGYGDTTSPPSPADYSIFHLVGDLVALLDALKLKKVFVVGHDWGAIVAWSFCLFRPDRVIALVNLSVPFRIFDSGRKKPVEEARSLLGDAYYICRFQAPGVSESYFSQVGTRRLLRKFFAFGAENPTSLPWLSEEDLDYYTDKFEKSGFSGGLNYYRSMDLNWELKKPWAGSQIIVPTMFIAGELDPIYLTPGIKEYIHEGGFQKDVPFLQEVVIVESAGHFINQERASEISDHICSFISKFF